MGAQNALLDLENLPQGSLDEFRDHYAKLAEHARAKGFDLRTVIAGMEAEEELSLRKKGRGAPKPKKAGKSRLAPVLKGT